ncbi:MAG: FIST C-terminal domain-containing protein [Leptolyngbyaceae cyanobacterium T60_A2020_046]|nr:FIST C-terminal domain-containing protein [Leptolyngbyaceae cyanobacterium T60_A2020_046]
MTTPMQWVSVLSTQASLEAAVRDVAEQAKRRLSAMPDLGLVFISSAFTSEFPRLLPLLHDAIELPVLIGCSGGGVIGVNDRGQVVEVEQKPALSLCLATLPGVTVTPFHLSQGTLPDLDSPPDTWVEQIGADPADAPHFILMADPFSSSVNDVLQGLDFAYPGAVKVGGLAGVNDFQGGSTLFLNQTLHSSGLVGVALAGNIAIDAIVAQGCRPIGKPYRVVEAERNIVLKLESPDSFGDGDLQTPLEALQGILKGLDEGDRKLAQHSLFIGVVQDGFKIDLHPGDFLIRNLLGVDPRSGAIAVGDRIRPGQRVQFHLRDARTSAEDLETLLLRYQAERSLNASAPAAGALMFACAGRGEGLYRKPNFDSQLFGRVLDTVPLSGFFCGGEIGPIGGTTFLHGYTSVFGICRPAQVSP